MSDTHIFETNVTWTEGKQGTLSDNGLPDITVATPPQFPGGVENVWSPEHLYVAALNVCLMTTFIAIAENSKLNFVSYTSNAKGKLERIEKRFMISEVTLYPEIVVEEEKDKDRAERIIQKAEDHCLISNSVKSEVKLEPTIKVKS